MIDVVRITSDHPTRPILWCPLKSHFLYLCRDFRGRLRFRPLKFLPVYANMKAQFFRGRTSLRWTWFFIGVCFLLAGSYLDNARGTLLPALSLEMGFDYKRSGEVLVGGHFCAFLLTLLLMPALNRLSLRMVSTATALLSLSVCVSVIRVSTVEGLIVWGSILGGVISLCGTISNLFAQRAADIEFRSRAMSASHASYGIASFFAPLIAAAVLQDPLRWRHLYFVMVPVFLLLAGVSYFKAPKRSLSTGEAQSRQSIHMTPVQWMMVLVVILYVAGEVLTSMWMATWFISRGASLKEGAQYTAAFFGIMTVTRLLCSIFMTSRWIRPTLWVSLILSVSCFVAGRFLDIPWLIPGMGLLGPFFPLFVSHLSLKFPASDRTITIWVLSLMQAMLGLIHLLIGELASRLGMDTAYWLAPFMILLCMVCLFLVRNQLLLSSDAPLDSDR